MAKEAHGMDERARFGEFFRKRRLALDKTLRQFCLENGLDAGNLSKMERGLLPPPQGERLREYARMLQLREGSDEWYEFCDLAAAEAGRLPVDLQSDAEVLKRMPVLFRAVRHGQDVAEEELTDLIEFIRKA